MNLITDNNYIRVYLDDDSHEVVVTDELTFDPALRQIGRGTHNPAETETPWRIKFYGLNWARTYKTPEEISEDYLQIFPRR
jgi:hypothetical protein